MSKLLSDERRWVVNFALIVVVFTSLPYLIGFFRQNETWHFVGFFFGVEDGNSYIAKMLSGAVGSWLFRSPYSAYPQNGFFAFFLYILLGKLTSSPGQHEQLIALFQLFRLVAAGFMIAATYDFVSIFIESINYRRWITVIATLGGGLGFLSIFGLSWLWKNNLPLEFYSPETFGFLSLFGLPHLAFGRSMLLWGFCSFFNGGNDRNNNYLTGILWSISGLMQPVNILLGWSVLGTYCIINVLGGIKKFHNNNTPWKESISDIRKVLLTIIITAPIVVYNIYSFSFDPYLKIWAQQNIILSPPITDYLLAYGLLLPIIIIGLPKLLQSRQKRTLFLLGWLLLVPFLVYFPVNLQRRLSEGSWVAVCILAIQIVSSLSKKWQSVVNLLLITSLFSSLILLSGGIYSVWGQNIPIYRKASEVDAFNFLAETALPNEVVLADFNVSNALPAWAPVKVIIGHGPESIHLSELKELVDISIQKHPNHTVLEKLMTDFNIRYIIDCNSKNERMLAPQFPVIFENEACIIFSP